MTGIFNDCTGGQYRQPAGASEATPAIPRGYHSVMDRRVRREQRATALQLRAAGWTWTEIADELRARWPALNPRAALRVAHGWTQADAAAAWTRLFPEQPKGDKDVGLWETRRPGFATLGRLARVYECAVADLLADVGDYRGLDSARHPAPPAGNMDGTDRRTFIASVAAVAADPSRLLDGVPTDRAPDRACVELVENAIAAIETRDAALGANQLLAGVAALRSQVDDWLTGPARSSAVSTDLEALSAELAAWQGWLAFDADDPQRASIALHEAIVRARLADDPRTEVQALSYLCLVDQRHNPRRALHDAETGQRIARGWGTPRLRAVLHLRAARAHAAAGDRRPFGREMAHALGHLDHGPHVDDPAFVRFVTPHEARGIAGSAHLALGDHDRAEREFRAIVDDPDPTYQRNTAYYRVRLAQVAADRGAISDAATTGLAAIPGVAATRSGRTRRLLDELRSSIEQSNDPTGAEFVDAYRTAFVA